MTDPVRALLDAARPAYEPSPEDQRRIRQALAVGLAPVSLADPTGAAAPAAGSATAAIAVKAVAAKVIVASLVVGAATFGAGFVTGRSTARAPQAAPAASAPVVTTSLPAPRPAAPVAVETPLPSAHPAHALPSAPSPHGSASAGSTLWEEAALLREAQRALRGGDPNASLTMLDRMAEKYPAGALEEERTAARVLALCGSGRGEEARALAARFLAQYPGSVHAARVRASCAASGL